MFNSNFLKSRFFGPVSCAAILLLAFQNCSPIKFSTAVAKDAGPPDTLPLQASCGTQDFVQPKAQITNKVDIVLVLHDTGSFAVNALNQVAGGMQVFLQNLPAGADYRISTITALNPIQDPISSGKVFGNILSSSNMSSTTLVDNLKNPPASSNGDHGEYGMSALAEALTTQLSYNQAAGALRPSAALAVFFLANEADICGLPLVDPGTDSAADYVEEIAEQRANCKGVTPQSVLAKIQSYAASNGAGYIVGSVIYTDLAIRANTSGEREFGFGYYQLVHDLLGGSLIDLNSGDAAIAEGVGSVGKLVAQIFNVKTDIVISKSNIDPKSVNVFVDGSGVSLPPKAITVQGSNIHIVNPADAGGPGSKLSIFYCQN